MPFEDLQRLHKAGQAVPAAEEAFRQVVREVLGEEGAAEALADPELAVLSRGGFVWLALAGDEKVPAGCVALHRVAEEGAAAADAGGETGRQTRWELRQLAVRPRWRRQGVGRLLVETLLRQFTEAAGDSEELVLEVPHSCEAARALLLKMGLVEAEAGEGGASSEGAVLMRLGTRTHRASGGPAASASPPAPRADPRYFD